MKYIALLTQLFPAYSSCAQVADHTMRLNESNIYYQVLTEYLHYVTAEEEKNMDTLYIEEKYRLSDSLLLQSGTTRFIKLRFDNIPAHIKKNQTLTLYRLFPLNYENREFSVSFNPYTVTYDRKKKHTHYAYSSTYTVTFRFEDNRFIFQKVKVVGI